MFLLFLLIHVLPEQEWMVYATNDNGKTGTISVTASRDSIGHHVLYVSDRIIETVLDDSDLSTLFVRKTIGDNVVLQIKREETFDVLYKGHKRRYHDERPIYDRHTLDFAMRGFDYDSEFRRVIRLHVPELTVVNANLDVRSVTTVMTPAGEFVCWEISMKPRIIFFGRVLFFYIEREYPHRFVKYVDRAGGLTITLMSYGRMQ